MLRTMLAHEGFGDSSSLWTCLACESMRLEHLPESVIDLAAPRWAEMDQETRSSKKRPPAGVAFLVLAISALFYAIIVEAGFSS